MENLKVYDNILDFIDRLPRTVSVFGYGSGVFKQEQTSSRRVKKTNKEPNQIDLILVVDDLRHFAIQNMKKNKHMYKLTPKLFFHFASESLLKKGAPICYTSNISDKGDVYKIGVVEKEDVIDDLLNWRTFYLAGRFQKEMYAAKGDPDIERANEINKQNALVLGLLLVDYEYPTIDELYENICSLSYMGDVRKNFNAEDPNKIKNIVKGSKDFLNREYRDKTSLFKVDEEGVLDIDYLSLRDEIDCLPQDLSVKLKETMKKNRSQGRYELDVRDTIEEHLSGIIGPSSKAQTLKGIWTTGPVKSLKYAAAKLKKGSQKK